MNTSFFTKAGIILFFTLYCCISVTYGQATHYSGTVTYGGTQTGIAGATLWVNGKALTATDEAGAFELLLDHPPVKTDTLIVTHLGYNAARIAIAALKPTGNNIQLTEVFYMLNEAVVTPVKLKKLMKAAVKQFKAAYRPHPCWAYTNYSQVVSYRGKACGYFEYEGKTLLDTRSRLQTMTNNPYMPDQIRRTVEDPIINLLFTSGGNEYWVSYQMSERLREFLFTDFVFFEVLHPLGKQNNEFDFNLDSINTVNGTPCYVISYRQSSTMRESGWKVMDMRGQLWINTENHNLVKATTSFNRSNYTFNEYTIDYREVNGGVYPCAMNTNLIVNRYGGKKTPQKIIVQSLVKFTKLAFLPDLKSNEYFSSSSCTPWHFLHEVPYNKDFWATRPINPLFLPKVQEITKGADLNDAFAQGSGVKIEEPINPDDPEMAKLMKHFRQVWELTKTETKNLKWE